MIKLYILEDFLNATNNQGVYLLSEKYGDLICVVMRGMNDWLTITFLTSADVWRAAKATF